MSQPWWRRLLPDRSHLLLLAGLAALVVATMGFIELYNIRSEALADHERAAAQVDQLREQNQMLQEALSEGQRGDNIEPRARQYFKYSRPGEKKVLFQTPAPPTPTPVPPEDYRPPGRSAWQDWLNRLLGR